MGKFNIEPVSFLLGILFCFIIAGIFAVVIADRRHRCSCGKRTEKICKLFGLAGHSRFIPFGTKFFWSYIFRPCVSGKHATVTIKVVTLTSDDMNRKPEKEFNWSDEQTARLCALTGVKNPAITSPGDTVMSRLVVLR